ncbi:MAG: hypothetical protein VKI83_02930 [Synechococcaceae cyanobacterium]|nr:hypothetical protein [Synechococcaceae cyanobacterium]
MLRLLPAASPGCIGLAAALLAISLTTPAPTSPAPPPAGDLCVIAPQIQADADGRATALVPLERPTLFVRAPLAEIRLERNGRLLWKQEGDGAGATPLEGPIAWPLAPLQPGEQLMLLLRPEGNPTDSFATIQLQAADSARLHASRNLLRSLEDDRVAWSRTIQRELARADPSLGVALLFAFEGPSEPALDGLRRAVAQQSCNSRPNPTAAGP